MEGMSMRVFRVLSVIAALGLLTGCGVAAKVEARHEYQQSLADYKQCLRTRPVPECEGLRRAVNADERAYNSMSAGIANGNRPYTINTNSD